MQELGLQQRPDVPIVAFIGRLAPQKGVDLIEQIFPWLMDKDQTGVTGDVQVSFALHYLYYIILYYIILNNLI